MRACSRPKFSTSHLIIFFLSTCHLIGPRSPFFHAHHVKLFAFLSHILSFSFLPLQTDRRSPIRRLSWLSFHVPLPGSFLPLVASVLLASLLQFYSIPSGSAGAKAEMHGCDRNRGRWARDHNGDIGLTKMEICCHRVFSLYLSLPTSSQNAVHATYSDTVLVEQIIHQRRTK
jgi:hypothetical protein